MSIEKVFSIAAAPEAIWDALWSEVLKGQQDAFSIDEAHKPNLLVLSIDLGGMPSTLTYKIVPQDDGSCEVTADIEPLSPRYRLFQIVTFGHLRKNYEMLLVHGLSNLKLAVEGTSVEDRAQSAE
jgi:hypothetical protein